MILLFRFYVKLSFGDSRRAKPAILTDLEALDLDFYEFLHFLRVRIHQIDKIQTTQKLQKCAVLELLESRFSNDRKILKFLHCFTFFKMDSLIQKIFVTSIFFFFRS